MQRYAMKLSFQGQVQPSIGEFVVALLLYAQSAPRLRTASFAVFAEVFGPCCDLMIREQTYLEAQDKQGQDRVKWEKYDKAQYQSAVQWYLEHDECHTLEDACEKVCLPRSQ